MVDFSQPIILLLNLKLQLISNSKRPKLVRTFKFKQKYFCTTKLVKNYSFFIVNNGKNNLDNSCLISQRLPAAGRDNKCSTYYFVITKSPYLLVTS